MGRFLYFLLFLLLARWLFRTVFNLFVTSGRQRVRTANWGLRTPIHKGMMVRDPSCGIHLPEERALETVRSGERFFFCSEECRTKFLEAD